MKEDLAMVVFEAASSLPDSGDRRMLLDLACRDDDRLRQMLETMLAERESAEEFFGFRSDPDPADAGDRGEPEGIDARIGRYRIVERIGAGGCGVVYLAEQMEPIQRKVALKIIRLGMDTESIVARFEAERQALATMNHPLIARVLDGGATESGRPYFVMELVDGEKITDFLDLQCFGLRERLEVFADVCQAIHHAHQKSIIHRDIKPSNVLVRQEEGRAFAKVIDFGIAKATTGGGMNDETFTMAEQFMGTPAYMSPEQALGRTDLDTRADIYSLGAMLYEVLTGRPAFDPVRLRSEGLEGMRHIISSEEPPCPSELIGSMDLAEAETVAQARNCDPARLKSLVKGDLDCIVMKAIAKERSLRYETANAMLLDIRRHLAGEPVSAGPPGTWYRMVKMIRRNRATVAAGVLVFLALAVGFGISTILFVREKQARAEQERLRNEADVARADERQLRKRAESRGILSEAAVSLAYGDMEGADELLSTVPLEDVPPSLEVANTFRTVGEWHVQNGRWKEAARAFNGLVDSLIGVDPTDSHYVSRNLLNSAAALCYARDIEGYERFRRIAIGRFGATSDPVVAEQIVKCTLIRPGDDEVMATAEMLGRKILDSHERGFGNPDLVKWSYVALALLDYRLGEWEDSTVWCRKAIDSTEDSWARHLSGQIIMAMCELEQGDTEMARQRLETAAPKVRTMIFRVPADQTGGFWFDWVFASILLEQAEELLRASAP